jgi:hypothetical protein
MTDHLDDHGYLVLRVSPELGESATSGALDRAAQILARVAPSACQLVGSEQVRTCDTALVGAGEQSGIPNVSSAPSAAGTSVLAVVYLTDVSLDNGPLFLVSALAATVHLTGLEGRDLARAAELWELPVCAPSGTVVLMRPDLYHRFGAPRRPDVRRTIVTSRFVALSPDGDRPTVTS